MIALLRDLSTLAMVPTSVASSSFLADMIPVLCADAFPPDPYRFSIPVGFFALGRDARPTLTAPQSWVMVWLVPVGMVAMFDVRLQLGRVVQDVCEFMYVFVRTDEVFLR